MDGITHIDGWLWNRHFDGRVHLAMLQSGNRLQKKLDIYQWQAKQTSCQLNRNFFDKVFVCFFIFRLSRVISSETFLSLSTVWLRWLPPRRIFMWHEEKKLGPCFFLWYYTACLHTLFPWRFSYIAWLVIVISTRRKWRMDGRPKRLST